MRYQQIQYGFPELVLGPGQSDAIKMDVRNPFRPEKIMMVGFMDAIRGNFKIKRSNLPLLNRDHVVCAYSRVYKRNKYLNHTVVEYDDGQKTVYETVHAIERCL